MRGQVSWHQAFPKAGACLLPVPGLSCTPFLVLQSLAQCFFRSYVNLSISLRRDSKTHMCSILSIYSCSCCRSFSFRFLQVCSVTESKAGSMEAFAKITYFFLHLPLKHPHGFKGFSQAFKYPWHFSSTKQNLDPQQKSNGYSAKLTHVLPCRSPMRMWTA